MKRNQSSEDYLETILLLSKEQEDVHRIDIARRMGVSQPAVQKAIKLLMDKQYVVSDGMHIVLTRTGMAYAKNVYHMHCTIRQFLILHGVDYENADADACEMEHYISGATFSAIEKFVAEADK